MRPVKVYVRCKRCGKTTEYLVASELMQRICHGEDVDKVLCMINETERKCFKDNICGGCLAKE